MLKYLIGLVVIAAYSICFVSAATDPSFKDIDCGWTGITAQQCAAKGCFWLENFKGPWCHLPSSPHIPSFWERAFSRMSENEIEVFQNAVICFVALAFVIMLSSRKTFLSIEVIAVGVLFALSLITRFYRIEEPKEVVFDEFYFGGFANSYCRRVYVFDIHPPLAKLTHYYFGSLLGAKCTMDFHASEGLEKYADYRQYVPYRIVSAIFGTLVVPLAYLVGRQFKLSVVGSIFLGVLVLTDSLLLSETRLILTDSQLFFYIVLSIYCALKLWDSDENSWSRTFWTVATAVASGCAFCVKFTALATLGWIAFCTYIVAFNKKPVGLLRCLVAAIIAAVVFIIPFYFHIMLGKKSGDADWNLDEEHQQLLIGNPYYNKNAVPPSFFSHLIYLLRRMLEQNAASLGDHPYASYWYEWVVGKGALLSYAEHRDNEDWHGHIFIVSNVFICYAILMAFTVFMAIAFSMIRSRISFRITEREIHFMKTGFLLFLGWIANLLPYALVARTTYSYHYLPGQFFGMIMVCKVVDEIPYFFLSLFFRGEQLRRVLFRVRASIVLLLILALLCNYYFYSCFSYGFGLTSAQWAQRKWIVGGV